jgi:hypothetical protein
VTWAASLLALIAAYWLLLLGTAAAGLWLAVRRRRLGLLLFVGSCAMAIATAYEPTLDNWLLARSTAQAVPPKALVFDSGSQDVERIAATFAATGLFEVYVASPSGGWLFNGRQLFVDKTNECVMAGALAKSFEAGRCIHYKDEMPLPGCRIEVKFDAPPPSSAFLAQEARIFITREAGESCPFFGFSRELPSYMWVTRGRLPYVTYFGRAISSVDSRRLSAIVPSPTRESLLRSLGIKASTP